MEPTICSGDLLLVDRSKLQVRGERIYLINLDDEVMVKRVEWLLDGTVVIRGDNTLVSREYGPAIQRPRETPYTWPFGADGKQDITFIISKSILQKQNLVTDGLITGNIHPQLSPFPNNHPVKGLNLCISSGSNILQHG